MFLKGALPMTHLSRLLSNRILCVSTLLTLVVDAVQCLKNLEEQLRVLYALVQPSDHVCVNRRVCFGGLGGIAPRADGHDRNGH